jgi:GT2 family glycosyltransferase
VKDSVFDRTGVFDENYVLGQYEDTDFFRRVKAANFTGGTVSDSFLHHFGSLTQLVLREEGELDYARGNKLYFREKWKMGWLKRKFEKIKLLTQLSPRVETGRMKPHLVIYHKQLGNLLLVEPGLPRLIDAYGGPVRPSCRWSL